MSKEQIRPVIIGWLFFNPVYKENRKTPIIELFNRDSQTLLGHIKWHGAWRKYCFFPKPDMLFDAGCLEVITKYIKEIPK